MTKKQQNQILKLAGTKSGRAIAREIGLTQTTVFKFMKSKNISNAFEYGVAQKQYSEQIAKYKNRAGLYYIKNVSNGRFYIGVSIDVGRRIAQHLMKLNKLKHKNKELQNDWNLKHVFDFGIITEGPKDTIELTRIEHNLIHLNKDSSLCYNKNNNRVQILINEKQVLRFESNIDKSGDCWYWTGKLDKDGYGKMAINKKRHYSHRLSYFIYKKQNPEGLLVCHSCDNPACVNPDHLFLGSDATNAKDCSNKGRKGRPRKCI